MLRYLIIATILLTASCKNAEKDQPVTDEVEASISTVVLTAEQIKTAELRFGGLEKTKLADLITVNGVVDVPPQNLVSVSFPLGGYLKRTDLLPGKNVRKGEVIGIMEDQSLVQLQQDYLVGKEKLHYLEQDFNRQKELNESNVNATKVFQQAAAELGSQKVMMRAMGEKLRLININPDKLTSENLSRSVPLYSPINGFVSKVFVNPGKYVQPSDVLFELIDPDDIHAALTVFQKDISKLAVGQEVVINFIDEPQKFYQGKVILVNRSLDENRSEVVHCHFTEHPKDLHPGMFLQAKIKTSPREVLALPEEAVVGFQGHEYIFIVGEAGKFEIVEVETGIREKGFIEIRNAGSFPATAKIVLANAYAVLGAMKNSGE